MSGSGLAETETQRLGARADDANLEARVSKGERHHIGDVLLVLDQQNVRLRAHDCSAQ